MQVPTLEQENREYMLSTYVYLCKNVCVWKVYAQVYLYI